MKIVVDTNVVISGTFFGGAPRRVVEAIGKKEIKAYATPEIIEEYEEIVEEMINRKQGNLRKDVLSLFIAKMNLIDNFGYKEIADALDMPINTVKTKIRRAKAQLLKMMDYSDELL